MRKLVDKIRASITVENSFDNTLEFIETHWFQQTKAGVWRLAYPDVVGTRVEVETPDKRLRIHVFWVKASSLRFGNTKVWLENGERRYGEPPFVPRQGDMFAYAFGSYGEETFFEVSSVPQESDDVLRE